MLCLHVCVCVGWFAKLDVVGHDLVTQLADEQVHVDLWYFADVAQGHGGGAVWVRLVDSLRSTQAPSCAQPWPPPASMRARRLACVACTCVRVAFLVRTGGIFVLFCVEMGCVGVWGLFVCFVVLGRAVLFALCG